MRRKLLVEERRPSLGRVGRRPLGLRLRAQAMLAAAVDVSVPCTRIVLADVNGEIIDRTEVGWHPHHRVFLGKLNQALKAIVGTIPRRHLLGVGVALPGTVDRLSGSVLAAENLGWFNVEAGRLIRRGINTRFYFENDARLSALAERWFPEPNAKPLENFVFVTTQGGLGTGLVVEGRLFRGACGPASEFGHTALYPDGRKCVCGNRGCWEEYASGRALRRLYAERAGVPDAVSAPGPDAIVAMARAGDVAASAALDEVAGHVGLGCANLIFAYIPEAIILGGYVGNAWDLIGEKVWGVIRDRVPGYYLNGMRIMPSRHGENCHIVGAVALVLANFFTVPLLPAADRMTAEHFL
jgi:predicted NBD/HSP70 family sugar kinase